MEENNVYAAPKARIAYTESADESAYPKVLIICSYTFLGGGLGGLILAIVWQFIMGDFVLMMPLIYAFFGTVFGMIPAGMTGVILVLKRQTIGHVADYLVVGLIGFVVTCICALVVFQSFQEINVVYWGALGGVSGMILAKPTLPKPTLPKGSERKLSENK